VHLEYEPDPWAMQLVARVERTDPPTRTDVLTASAQAVVALLDDPRALPGGEWFDAVTSWTDRRIRKHCRRARGIAWERAEAVDGVTVAHGTALVRAYPPTPVGEIPVHVGKLQLEGSTELPDPDRVEALLGPDHGVVVAVSAEPFLPWGKAAAATGHAAQIARAQMGGRKARRWREAGHPLRVVQPGVAGWREALRTADVVIQDGGHTVVAPGTVTAVAWF
jgi:peptidyl-tRNA hydrolase